MKQLRGQGVSPGIAIGRAFIYDPAVHINTRKVPPSRVAREVARLQRALVQAAEELVGVRERVRERLGDQAAGIFTFQLFVLEDPEFGPNAVKLVQTERVNPDAAVHRTITELVQRMSELDPYLRERANDFHDLEERIVRALQGRATSDLSKCPEGAIVLGPDLSPSQTVGLDRRKVAGFVTETGGSTSHTAILAKNLGIPAIVGVGRLMHQIADGEEVIVDGTTGVVILRPDRRTLAQYRMRAEAIASFEERLVLEFRDLPPQTRDGCEFELLGNIEFPDEVPAALAAGAAGIGLYRTEFLFLDPTQDAGEEAQVAAYTRALDELGGRPLVIRTMDLGADKPVPGLTPTHELNPFLGCRSIRLSLRHPLMFRTQLRAVMRVAAQGGDVRLMFPMISSLADLRRAREHLATAASELEAAGVPYRSDLSLGIMVEVPAAVTIGDLLAREVDFFSIGTNDLIQYALAVDRVNPQVAHFYQPTHPAILRMLKTVIDTANAADIHVSVCGEMSGNVAYSVLLAGLGLREMSVSPASIPEIKKVLRAVTLKEARKMAARALSLSTAEEVETYLLGIARSIIPERFEDFAAADADEEG